MEEFEGRGGFRWGMKDMREIDTMKKSECLDSRRERKTKYSAHVTA